jgi:hypothetical protein
MMRHRRSLLTAPALIVAGALLGWIFAPPDAQAQERRIMISDDGSGPTFFHVSLPDLRALGRPDFERSDLPVFKERLRLDALQQIVLETLLSAYLEEFDEKIRQQLPRLPQRMSIPGGQMEEHAHGQGGSMDSLMGEAMAQAGHVHEDLDIEVDGSGSVAVFIGAQGMGEGPAELPEGVVEEGGDFDVVVQSQTPEGDTNAAVMISVATPDGEPLPDEVREKLEARAKEIAERVQQQIAEAEAAGVDPLPGLTPERLEEQQANLEAVADTAAELKKTKARLRDVFVAQVQGQLSSDQIDRWPRLERALVRHKTLDQGRLDGERTDLIKLVKGLDLDELERETIAATLDEYELALHAALVQRNAVVDAANAKVDEAIRAGDVDDALEIVDRAAKTRVAVREVNRTYADLLAAKLGSPLAEMLKAKTLKVFHPRIYKRTLAQKAFGQARALDGLDDEMIAGIDELEEAYDSELASINEQLRQTVLTHQPREPRRALERLKDAMGGEEVTLSWSPGDDPVRKAYRDRAEFDERYMTQLYGMLAPEQVSLLPPLPSAARPKPIIFETIGPD